MPAEQIPQTEIQSANEAMTNPSFAVFGDHLQAQASVVGELAENQDAIREAGNQLIEEYDLKPSLFENEGRSFVFTAIAERKVAGVPEDDDFIGSALALLAYKHSDKLAPVGDLVKEAEGGLTQVQEDAIHDKYTHKPLSNEFSQAVKNGDMLSDVKSRLGITPDNEQPFEIKVLTVEHGHKSGFGMDSAGIYAPFTPWEEVPGDTHQEKSAYTQAENDTIDAVKKHKEDLLKRGKQMEDELGHEIARAWVTTNHEGQRVLYLSMPLAEKLLDPSLTDNALSYTEKDRQSDLALLEHEYVHTQGGMNIDNGVFFGISLEERRAEYFSGDKHGYQDVKGLMLDVAVASNMLVTNLFADKPFGGKQSELYTDLANRIGVRNTLELLVLPPQAYIDRNQGNVLQRALVEYIGGYDGLIKHILERSIANGQKTDIESRVKERAKIIKAQGEYSDWVLQYRRKFGLNVMTDLYQASMAELGEEDQ
ncbi:MAG TPA: hypothetical protein VFN31_02185 [Candidatus Saccharimonadales bacterium]|nr:hypothetical protein [Candidatus Saccharimonadales bacterium]